MRTPAFWNRRQPDVAARLLTPAGLVYGWVSGHRMLRGRGHRAAVPVVCVGNFTAGGAGKTPTAIALARLARRLGHVPIFVSRGHGGRLAGPVRVDPAHHRAADVGDEPLLLARTAPTVVAKARVEGVRMAAASGADLVILDDGLQNPSVEKDFALAVVDAETGVGNGLVMPAGPLRAPLPVQMAKTHAVLLLGAGEPERVCQEARRFGVPVLRGRLAPSPELARLEGARVVAYAGLGRPEKMFDMLVRNGVEIVARFPFPDHHPYSPEEARHLLEAAREAHAVLVTTAKDVVRLEGRGGALSELQAASRVVDVTIELPEAELVPLLAPILSPSR
jgi:tetraacyldisaccharide 4'-kinase